MIKNWQSHQEYLYFLHEAKIHFDSSQRSRLAGEFAAAREKLRLLNLDPVMELLEPYYPPSLVLMQDHGFTSITAWLKKRNSDTLLAFLVTEPASIPMPALMGIKHAGVRIMEKTAATVRAIISILMSIGDGTAILELTILDIRCICCLTMTASLESTFLRIFVFWMQDAMTVSADCYA